MFYLSNSTCVNMEIAIAFMFPLKVMGVMATEDEGYKSSYQHVPQTLKMMMIFTFCVT